MVSFFFFFLICNLGSVPLFCFINNTVYFKLANTCKCLVDLYGDFDCLWKGLTWVDLTSETIAFIISVCLPGSFLRAPGAIRVCRVEVVVVWGNQTQAVVFYCAAIQLCSSSHQIRSSHSGDLTFPFSVTNLTTNCSLPMYWNKRVTFYTSGTVLEWDSHMLMISFSLVSYISMQFSDGHAGHRQTGLRLRNPDVLYPIFISDQTPPPPCFISEQSLCLDHHFASCTSCRNCFIQTISGVETMGSSCTNPGTDA